MKIKSLAIDQKNLVPVEVEIAFLPGLPQVQFLGLPDQLIKESIYRLRSAFQASGYEFPKTHQTIINIKPQHFRKSSRGLELAVALGILAATQQIQLPEEILNSTVYGEIGLDGSVAAPDDLFELSSWKAEDPIVTTGVLPRAADFSTWQVSSLQELGFEFSEKQNLDHLVQRPHHYLQFDFTYEQGRLLSLAALSQHHLFLAGPAGIGKSTMAKALSALMPEPSLTQILEARLRTAEKNLHWWPMLSPHHTVTPLGMTGGGAQMASGEIARSHRGLLVLDEYLEFHPRVQEVLREPMEESFLRIVRGHKWEKFETDIQVVATTNLCPCGKWNLDKNILCRRAIYKCRSYREKLSGPVLDRFQLFKVFSSLKGSEKVAGSELLARLSSIRSALPPEVLRTSRFSDLELRKFEPQKASASFLGLQSLSPRRALQVRRVALSLAFLDGQTSSKDRHLEEARLYSQRDLEKLEQG